MSRATGFDYTMRKSGEVVISKDGRVAAVLRGRTAVRFLEEVVDHDPQELMARLTGNFKRGNERR